MPSALTHAPDMFHPFRAGIHLGREPRALPWAVTLRAVEACPGQPGAALVYHMMPRWAFSLRQSKTHQFESHPTQARILTKLSAAKFGRYPELCEIERLVPSAITMADQASLAIVAQQ
jgi:hypothetical protein